MIGLPHGKLHESSSHGCIWLCEGVVCASDTVVKRQQCVKRHHTCINTPYAQAHTYAPGTGNRMRTGSCRCGLAMATRISEHPTCEPFQSEKYCHKCASFATLCKTAPSARALTAASGSWLCCASRSQHTAAAAHSIDHSSTKD